MNNTITIDLRRFPVAVKNADGDILNDSIVISKNQLQAAQIVGQSSKEIISRMYLRKGFKVLDIGKAEKKSVSINLDSLWDMLDKYGVED